MDEAAAVITDQEAATERLDGFALRNQEPLESLAGIMKLGNQIGIETAGSVKELDRPHSRSVPSSRPTSARRRTGKGGSRMPGCATIMAPPATGRALRSWQPETTKVGW